MAHLITLFWRDIPAQVIAELDAGVIGSRQNRTAAPFCHRDRCGGDER